MTIFTTTEQSDILILPTGPQYAGLRTSLAALMDAHRALSGCQPTEDQAAEIAQRSGEAVGAIMAILIAVSRQQAESQH